MSLLLLVGRVFVTYVFESTYYRNSIMMLAACVYSFDGMPLLLRATVKYVLCKD